MVAKLGLTFFKNKINRYSAFPHSALKNKSNGSAQGTLGVLPI